MIDEVEDFSPDNYTGKNNRYGVCEHAMTSILNGILLHGDAKLFVSIFFVFSNCLRPADANEVAAASKAALESEDRPTLLALIRQDIPILPNTEELTSENIEKEAFALSPVEGETEGLFLVTGSEV